jgi:arginase
MVAPGDAVLLGHRADDLDPGAAAELARVPTDLRHIDAGVASRDPAAAGERAAAWLSGSGRGAWLHVDLDVLDPASLPAVTYPQPAGLDWDQLAELLAPLARSPDLLGVSLADFRPDLDATGELANKVVALVDRVLP